MAGMDDDAPYAGLRVLDLSQGIAGPYCAMLLAQYGADVVKLEPLEGDWLRELDMPPGRPVVFLAFNRGKRSIAVDLRAPEGVDVAKRLAAGADVILESFRPGVAARLGVGYDDVREGNPGAIYLSVSGYGARGPWRERPATVAVMQAVSGLMDFNRAGDGEPKRVRMAPIDVSAGLYAFQSVSTALYARAVGGGDRGRWIDISLMQTAAAFQAAKIAEHHASDGNPSDDYAFPLGRFPTADGYISISTMRDSQFRTLCEALDVGEAVADERFASNAKRIENRDALFAILADKLRRRSTEEWTRDLTAGGIMSAKVQTYDEFVRHPHVAAAGAVTWVPRQGGDAVPIAAVPGLAAPAPDDPLVRAPALGQHGSEIMAEMGLGADEIAELERRGLVLAAPVSAGYT